MARSNSWDAIIKLHMILMLMFARLFGERHVIDLELNKAKLWQSIRCNRAHRLSQVVGCKRKQWVSKYNFNYAIYYCSWRKNRQTRQTTTTRPLFASLCICINIPTHAQICICMYVCVYILQLVKPVASKLLCSDCPVARKLPRSH